MGGFGDKVSDLLELYGRCLSLLKAFKVTPESDVDSLHSRASLRQSIRSDRTRVQKAYTRRLGRDGNRLAKGDKPSRSALRRILNSLKAAMVNMLQTVKAHDSGLDYASLMSLSNASRADTIRTIDELSKRLRSRSSGSVRTAASSLSSTSSSASASSTPGKKKIGKASMSSAKEARSQTKPKATAVIKIDKEPAARNNHERNHSSRSEVRPSDKSRKVTKPDARSQVREGERPAGRISFISTSSNSTRLGEIRLSRRFEDLDEVFYDYRPMYSLPAYRHRDMEDLDTPRPGLLRRLFGQRRAR
ncbi:hypothetical protein F5Y15DRAFT_214304 [Xylariaceae sp. FL0016]|nr:hypothetical protein F5Y15DRAFT_214304 [Xylariaceae sp. FL0016]